MKKERIVFRPDQKVLEKDGKIFVCKTTKYKKIDGVEHEDKIIFEEIDQTDFDKKRDYVKSKIMKSIPPERVAEEVIKNLDLKSLDKVYNLLQDKNVKVGRHDGCLGLKIGKGRGSAYIEVFD